MWGVGGVISRLFISNPPSSDWESSRKPDWTWVASNTGNLAWGEQKQCSVPAQRREMSRYPSAYGHTPSYKSVGGLTGSSYPSALGSSLGSSTSSSLTRDMDREMGAMRREMDRDFGGVLSVSLYNWRQSVFMIYLMRLRRFNKMNEKSSKRSFLASRNSINILQ